MSDMPSSRPTVEQQMDTLKAIMDYNKKLPKRRKAKGPHPTKSNIARPNSRVNISLVLSMEEN
jgi:hypothetical protein